MTRVLFVHSRKASFVAIDREILAERYEIEDLYQPGRFPNPIAVIGGVLRADLVFGWFASWHTFLPITLASLLRVTVVHHGVPDPFGELPAPKRRESVTVGAIDRTTLVQKGQLEFVRAAAELPDVKFVFAGKWLDDAVDVLRAEASDNVELTGWAVPVFTGELIRADESNPEDPADSVRER